MFAMSYMVGGEDKRENNRTVLPILKNSAAAGYKGSVKVLLLKGAGLLQMCGLTYDFPDRYKSVPQYGRVCSIY